MNAGWVRRDQALSLVNQVAPEIQARIAAERARLDLSAADDEPITGGDEQLYRCMVERVRNPQV